MRRKFNPAPLAADPIFDVTGASFQEAALELCREQLRTNPVYRRFAEGIRRATPSIFAEIPFLPISFFRTGEIISGVGQARIIFESSSTTTTTSSKHHVLHPELYDASIAKCFQRFYGDPGNYCILALLPSYMERPNASLVYMVKKLIETSNDIRSGFYLRHNEELLRNLEASKAEGRPTILLGVSFALLDLAEEHDLQLDPIIVMETGGMKGRRKELVREELHGILKKRLGVVAVHSEYGMTELLSQAYSLGDGRFRTPPWMQVLVRDPYDPLQLLPAGRSGALSIIDLVNRDSCAFIATDDIGKLHADGSFEVLGRLDNSDLRGCNLMVS